MNKKITIGIPTYEAGESLLVTLKSIYNQSAYKYIEKIILAVDGNNVPPQILSEIQNNKLEVHNFRVRKGQAGRINDICKIANTDFLILTNDDVILDEFAVERMAVEYNRSKADLIAGIAKPLHSSTFFEKALEMGTSINNLIASRWNRGDNYLSVNGRFIGVSKKLYKEISLPEKLWNNDAYFYLFTKLSGFSFARAVRATVYFKSPSNLADHLKQSKKFQNSYLENKRYFKSDISKYYKVPKRIRIGVLPRVMLENPNAFAVYIATFLFTRLDNIMNKKVLPKSGFWPTDVSTKILRML